MAPTCANARSEAHASARIRHTHTPHAPPPPMRTRAQVRVQAGCRVQQVADHLKPYGLTLQNYASIREQQIGGFTQVRGFPKCRVGQGRVG